MRKPEVFKMACLRDILNLFGQKHNPFYAGFGNRLTDALSYRSVNIPSTRIFTINSYAEVSLDLLTLTTYKSSYVNMRDLVDHYFPPVALLSQDEQYTDFNYWREPLPDPEDFSDSDEEEEEGDEEEEEEEEEGDMGESYYEDEHGMGESYYTENAEDGDGEEEYVDDGEDEEEDDEEGEGEGEEEEEEEEGGGGGVDGPERSQLAEGFIDGQDDVEKVKEGKSFSDRVPGLGVGKIGMKMDLDQGRLHQAVEFAEREMSGIMDEVVREIQVLTERKKDELEEEEEKEKEVAGGGSCLMLRHVE